MKYIDADRLRKEIDHRIDILAGVSIKCAKNDDIEMHNYYHGKAISLDELLSFIDSLQQEQDTIIINKKDWEVQERFRKNKDFGKPIQQEQPEMDLEKEIEDYWLATDWCHVIELRLFKVIARYFYGLGLNARKEG